MVSPHDKATEHGTSSGRGSGRRGSLLPRPGRRHGATATGIAVALGVSALALGPLAPASAASSRPRKAPPFLEAVAVPGYGTVLASSKGFSLYALSSERGSKQACSGACLSVWPPVLVGSKVKTVSLGAGVTGHIGFVQRGATKKQVTLNGYPLFFFAKDTGPRQSHGEGIAAFGGTWTLVRPSAKTPAATLVHSSKAPAKKSTSSYGSGY